MFRCIGSRFISLVSNRTMLLGSDTVLGRELTPELKIFYSLDSFYSLGKDIKEEVHEKQYKLKEFNQILGGFNKHKPNLVILCNPLYEANNIKIYLNQVTKLLDTAKTFNTRYILLLTKE